MVVSLNRGTQIQTPKYYDSCYRDPPEGYPLVLGNPKTLLSLCNLYKTRIHLYVTVAPINPIYPYVTPNKPFTNTSERRVLLRPEDDDTYLPLQGWQVV